MSRVLRVARVYDGITALGPGRRLGVWVQGCPLACPGCMAQDTWDPAGGQAVTIEALLQRWRAAIRGGTDGVTISGGEPLADPAAMAELLHGIASSRADITGPGGVAAGRQLDILLFTGYEPTEFTPAQEEAAHLADAVVTGRFQAGNPTDLIWRGSANQRLIPMTALGARRYRPYLDHRVTRPPLQLVDEPPGVLLVGVPRGGDLARLEKWLRQRSVDVRSTSWRRAGASRQLRPNEPRSSAQE